MSLSLRYSHPIVLFARTLFICFAIAGVFVRHCIAQEITRSQQSQVSPDVTACTAKGMKLVIASEDVGVVCEPRGEDALSRIISCLSVGMEAVANSTMGAALDQLGVSQ